MPENEEAARVFLLARRQIIAGPEGIPIDISIPAVKVVMDLLRVEGQKDCLIKVIKTWHHFERLRSQ
jgi:hypothetical protein